MAEDRPVGADRVLAVLQELGAHPAGLTLDELTRRLASAKPTVHRALATLRGRGLATQDASGRYLLGDEFLRIAFANHEARPEHLRVAPVLERLAAEFGETAHFAVLDGRDVVYRAKQDPAAGAMRLSSVVGGRNPAHATGVGKMLLALLLPDEAAVRDWLGGEELSRPRPATLVAPAALAADLAEVRRRGYAVEDQENEPGIVCLAVPVYFGSPQRPSGAISVTALAHRTPLAELERRVGDIRAALGAAAGA